MTAANVSETLAAWAAVRARVRRPQSEVEYLALLEFLNHLVDHEDVESEPGRSLFVLAANYAHEWEREHEPPIPESAPHELLAFLMDQHGLKQMDLEREGIVDQGLLANILAGRRAISKALAKRLAERFHVSPATFL